MKAVYFFCQYLDKDPVAYRVYQECLRLYELKPSEKKLDGLEAWESSDENGNIFHFVLTTDTLSHEFDRHVESLNSLFPKEEFDFAGIVNWHGGNNAPDNIFCFHGVGHPASTDFALSHSQYLFNIANSINNEMAKEGISQDWRVLPEATHYSGIPYGCVPKNITRWDVPQADIEIGSSASAWGNPLAVKVLAKSLGHVFDVPQKQPISALFVGGIHFEPTLRNLMFTDQNENHAYVFAHALTYPWVVEGTVEDEHLENELCSRLSSAIQCIVPRPTVIVFHDKSKAVLKNAAKKVAFEYKMDCINHKSLKKT